MGGGAIGETAPPGPGPGQVLFDSDPDARLTASASVRSMKVSVRFSDLRSPRTALQNQSSSPGRKYNAPSGRYRKVTLFRSTRNPPKSLAIFG